MASSSDVAYSGPQRLGRRFYHLFHGPNGVIEWVLGDVSKERKKGLIDHLSKELGEHFGTGGEEHISHYGWLCVTPYGLQERLNHTISRSSKTSTDAIVDMIEQAKGSMLNRVKQTLAQNHNNQLTPIIAEAGMLEDMEALRSKIKIRTATDLLCLRLDVSAIVRHWVVTRT